MEEEEESGLAPLLQLLLQATILRRGLFCSSRHPSRDNQPSLSKGSFLGFTSTVLDAAVITVLFDLCHQQLKQSTYIVQYIIPPRTLLRNSLRKIIFFSVFISHQSIALFHNLLHCTGGKNSYGYSQARHGKFDRLRSNRPSQRNLQHTFQLATPAPAMQFEAGELYFTLTLWLLSFMQPLDVKVNQERPKKATARKS